MGREGIVQGFPASLPRQIVVSSGTDMNVADVLDQPSIFATQVDPAISRRLQSAVEDRQRNRFEAEQLLWEARAENPCCLPVYFALYKFYANARRLNDAARVSRLALTESARQGGFHSNWEKLNSGAAGAKQVDLYASEAGLFYLMALKSLAFIKLRQKQMADARAILMHLARLDAEDRSGFSVVATLAEAVGLSFQDAANE